MRRALWSILTILSILSSAWAQQPAAYTLDDLSRRPWSELEAIYRAASPGNAPTGFLRGHTVFRETDTLAGPREKIANFAWQGKHFSDGALINQFRGLRMIKATVAPGESWLDGRPALILDYRGTSLLWNDVRDEMREVSPGVYVGCMYLDKGGCDRRLKVMFVLEAEGCCK